MLITYVTKPLRIRFTISSLASSVIFFLILVLIPFSFKNFAVPFVASIVSWFSIMNRFTGFYLGYMDLSSVVYYLSIAAVFVFLTVQSIEKKRWN